MSESANQTVQGENASAEKTTANTPSRPPRTFGLRLRQIADSATLLRAAREIAIVTLGILIAFALNTWWENHKEARQEQQHLRALVSDFEQNVGQLKEMIAAQERIAANSLTLLKATRSTEAMSADQTQELIAGVFSSKRFEPVMGAYEGLVNSAGLTLVRNNKLRAALASFAAAVSGRYGERFGDEMFFSFIREFVGKLQFADLLIGAPTSPKAYAAVLADAKFQDYLAVRYQMEGQIAEQYRRRLQQSEEILALLQKEIR
jgi:hypothetical protein